MTTQLTKAILEEKANILAVLKINDKDNYEARFITELAYLEAIATMKPEIKDVDTNCAIIELKKVLSLNLSLNPDLNLVYVTTRNFYPDKNDFSKKIIMLELKPTVNGMLSAAMQLGTILDYKIPVVSYDNQGKPTICEFEFLVPSGKGERWEKASYGMIDVARWRAASEKQNSKKIKGETIPGQPNALYTSFNGSIDPAFFATKCMRHALKNRRGNPLAPYNKKSALTTINLPTEIVEADKVGIVEEIQVAEIIQDFEI